MKPKELVTGIKFWIVAVVTILGGLTALGATVDRPAWISEVHGVSIEVEKMAERVAANERAYLQLQIDLVQRRIWVIEDRLRQHFTEADNNQLRELNRQLIRLHEQLSRIRG